MKKILLITLLTTGIISVSFLSKKENEQEPIITTKTITQVAIIVKDIDKARSAWAEILGVKAPEVSVAESHFSRPTLYRGSPSDAKAKLAFFSMNNLQIELIQPLGGKSTWQEYLDKFGGWDGGAYSYIDASKKLGCMLELLENYR